MKDIVKKMCPYLDDTNDFESVPSEEILYDLLDDINFYRKDDYILSLADDVSVFTGLPVENYELYYQMLYDAYVALVGNPMSDSSEFIDLMNDKLTRLIKHEMFAIYDIKRAFHKNLAKEEEKIFKYLFHAHIALESFKYYSNEIKNATISDMRKALFKESYYVKIARIMGEIESLRDGEDVNPLYTEKDLNTVIQNIRADLIKEML